MSNTAATVKPMSPPALQAAPTFVEQSMMRDSNVATTSATATTRLSSSAGAPASAGNHSQSSPMAMTPMMSPVTSANPALSSSSSSTSWPQSPSSLPGGGGGGGGEQSQEDDETRPRHDENHNSSLYHDHDYNHKNNDNYYNTNNKNSTKPVSPPFPQMSFDADVNHFQQSPKIRKNPRDAASPRRSRMVVKRQEYNVGGIGTTKNASNSIAANVPLTAPSSSNNNMDGSTVASLLFDATGSISLASLKTEGSRSMGAGTGTGTGASCSSSPSSFAALGYLQNAAPSGVVVAGVDAASLSSTKSKSRPKRNHPDQNNNNSSSNNTTQASPLTYSPYTSTASGQMSHRGHVKRYSLDLGQEQILFEQRLCDVNYGVAVRKIHSNGKSQLRYVRCVPLVQAAGTKGVSSTMTATTTTGNRNNKNNNMSLSVPDVGRKKNSASSSSRSVTSLMGRISLGSHRRSNKYKVTHGDGGNASTVDVVDSKDTRYGNHLNLTEKQEMKQTMALTWGNKKKVVMPLCNFVEVRKGKTTSRTRKNPCHPSKLLSLLTNDKRHGHGSLDIEAPTKLDRDKFAKAFAVFLDIPLKDDFVGEDVNIQPEQVDHRYGGTHEGQIIPDDLSSLRSVSTSSSIMTPHGMVEYHIGGGGALLPSLSSSPGSSSSRDESSKLIMEKKNISLENSSSGHGSKSVKSSDSLNDLLRPLSSNAGMKPESSSHLSDVVKPIPDAKKSSKKNEGEDDDVSGVSSLTQGYDQEIVEELHQAIKDLRAELDASRAEAARAVKVAEQAIQSAESCSSNDWNSTVTHKAAEAAAQAQTRSAEALAKQRLAEEKLAAERKSSSFWRKQAQSAQDQASSLQTRLAVAQVQRAAVAEELGREKSKAMTYIKTLKQDYSMQESIQRDKISNAAEQNRLLEIELDGTRRDLMAKCEEAKSLQESISELKSYIQSAGRYGNKKTFFGKGNNKFREPLLLENQMNSTENNDSPSIKLQYDDLHAEELLKIRAEASAVKKQFEVLRRTTQEELSQLPEYAKEWAIQASRALNVVQVEVDMLKNQLALEVANRRKLLHEVQDLRGNVRVYCRPLPMSNSSETANDKASIIESPSHDTLVLRRDIALKKKGVMAKPMCFEFDHVFSLNATQSEVYAEMEELVLGTLEGFKTCLIAYGQTGSGKTRSMIGEFNISQGDGFGDDAIPAVDLNHLGIHLSAARQLFQVSSERKNIFEDTFTLSILEIQEEKLIDLVAGTDIAESTGVMNYTDGGSRRSTITSSESRSKLEIGTNHEGDTIVQGQVSVPVENFDDVLTVWKQSLGQRAKMMQENGISFETNDQCRHLIATIEIISTNITTGIGTYGKLQCVDLAASDVTQKRGSNSGRSKGTGMDSVLASLEDNTEWKFVNKSINTLADVVDARVNFSRNPPYRNSTLTHVLRDALEADTKTLFLVCVKPESKDVQDAANSLRFASKIRKVVIGKATKRYLTVA